jgi:hypothetical protein
MHNRCSVATTSRDIARVRRCVNRGQTDCSQDGGSAADADFPCARRLLAILDRLSATRSVWLVHGCDISTCDRCKVSNLSSQAGQKARPATDSAATRRRE